MTILAIFFVIILYNKTINEMIFTKASTKIIQYTIHIVKFHMQRQDPNVSLLIFRQLRQEKTESRNWNEKLYFVACRHREGKRCKTLMTRAGNARRSC